jgi:hypothetical protein
VAIGVFTSADWKTLRHEGLLTVLDPLVFRTADAFMRGAPSEGDQAIAEALEKNVDALAAFVDAVMLHDRLPLFDYGVSWEPNLAGSDATLLELANAEEEVLVDVHVDGAAYQEARAPAVAALQALPAIDKSLLVEIKKDLSAFEYRWRPLLNELGDVDEDTMSVARLRYGGLLFHFYADSISDRRQPLDQRAEHVLHARRGLMMVASSLAPGGELQLDEVRLLRRLHSVEDAMDGVEAINLRAPTFLPLLLAKRPKSPRHLLQLALKERRGGLVHSYRDWRKQLLADLADGRVRASTKRDLQAIAEEVQRKARGDAAVALHLSYAADWKLLLAAFVHPAALAGGLKIAADIDEKALRYRLASVLPGRGYRKMLSRVVAAQAEYFALERAVRNLWYRSASA